MASVSHSREVFGRVIDLSAADHRLRVTGRIHTAGCEG